MKKVLAKDYGLIPNVRRDSTKLLGHLLEQFRQDTIFELEYGEYHFYSTEAMEREYILSNTGEQGTRYCSIVLDNMKNIVIDGQGSQLTFHGKLQPISIDNCSEIVVQNIDIDWEIPLTAEGVVIDCKENYVDIRIDHSQFPYYIKENKLVFIGEDWESELWKSGHIEFDGEYKQVGFLSGDTFPETTQEELSPGVIRFHGDFKKMYQINNIIVLRHGSRKHAGIFAQESSNLHFDNIAIHCTGGLGILAQFCENLYFKEIVFKPSEKRNRKISSGHDDGIHLSNNSGLVVVENSVFRGLMDDSINIHGTSVIIGEKVNSKTLLCRFGSKESSGFKHWVKKGQEISFLKSKTLQSVGKGIVVSYKLIEEESFILCFEQDVPDEIRAGDAIENLSNTAEFICRNNYFGSGRARGLLVSTPKPVLIEYNIFESSGTAILIAGDANFWYESGACHDVVIKNNMFNSVCLSSNYMSCEAIISICPEILEPDKEKPFHSSIYIEGNVFTPFDYPVLYAKSTTGLWFNNNRIIRSHIFAPWHPRKHMLTFEYCSDVNVSGNVMVGNVLGKDVNIRGMDQTDVKLDPLQGINFSI